MTDRPPLHDYTRSRAVVMGTWNYGFLEPVPAAKNSMRRMAGLLTGPLCDWPRERVLTLDNVPSPGDLPDQLITALDGISDVAVFYYVGHGQISPDDELCLGLVQSRSDAHRRAATSLRFSDVRRALLNSDAATKIVILDCCFAGLATTKSLAGLVGDKLDLTAVAGAYTMAATSPYGTAWYEDSPGLVQPQTYFTKYLVDLIERGIPGQPSKLRLDPLFKRLRDNLTADQRPVPHQRAVDDARNFEFAYNAAPLQTIRDPEREVVQLTQRLAKSDAQIQRLQAEAAELIAELERLKNRMASARPSSVEQQQELQDRIDQTARELDDARAALPQADNREIDIADRSTSAKLVNETPGGTASNRPVVRGGTRARNGSARPRGGLDEAARDAVNVMSARPVATRSSARQGSTSKPRGTQTRSGHKSPVPKKKSSSATGRKPATARGRTGKVSSGKGTRSRTRGRSSAPSPDPVAILIGWIGKAIAHAWMAMAGSVGLAARAVGRGARDLDPHHRRDGVGLLTLGVAIVLGASLWGRMDNTVGRPIQAVAVDAFGSLSWVFPVLALLLAWRFLRHPDRSSQTARAGIGWAMLLLGVLGMIHIAKGTPHPSDGSRALHLAGGYVGYAVSGPLAAAVTPWVAGPLLALLAAFGLLAISGTPLRRVPERLAELREMFGHGRARAAYGDEDDLEIDEAYEAGTGAVRLARGQIARQIRLRPAIEAGEQIEPYDTPLLEKGKRQGN